MKLYRYVGPEAIRTRVAQAPPGTKITSAHDLVEWLHLTGQQPNREGQFAITFVVDEQGCLLVADRHSEHVACAGSRPVLSAGEMFMLKTIVKDGWFACGTCGAELPVAWNF